MDDAQQAKSSRMRALMGRRWLGRAPPRSSFSKEFARDDSSAALSFAGNASRSSIREPSTRVLLSSRNTQAARKSQAKERDQQGEVDNDDADDPYTMEDILSIASRGMGTRGTHSRANGCYSTRRHKSFDSDDDDCSRASTINFMKMDTHNDDDDDDDDDDDSDDSDDSSRDDDAAAAVPQAKSSGPEKEISPTCEASALLTPKGDGHPFEERPAPVQLVNTYGTAASTSRTGPPPSQKHPLRSRIVTPPPKSEMAPSQNLGMKPSQNPSSNRVILGGEIIRNQRPPPSSRNLQLDHKKLRINNYTGNGAVLMESHVLGHTGFDVGETPEDRQYRIDNSRSGSIPKHKPNAPNLSNDVLAAFHQLVSSSQQSNALSLMPQALPSCSRSGSDNAIAPGTLGTPQGSRALVRVDPAPDHSRERRPQSPVRDNVTTPRIKGTPHASRPPARLDAARGNLQHHNSREYAPHPPVRDIATAARGQGTPHASRPPARFDPTPHNLQHHHSREYIPHAPNRAPSSAGRGGISNTVRREVELGGQSSVIPMSLRSHETYAPAPLYNAEMAEHSNGHRLPMVLIDGSNARSHNQQNRADRGSTSRPIFYHDPTTLHSAALSGPTYRPRAASSSIFSDFNQRPPQHHAYHVSQSYDYGSGGNPAESSADSLLNTLSPDDLKRAEEEMLELALGRSMAGLKVESPSSVEHHQMPPTPTYNDAVRVPHNSTLSLLAVQPQPPHESRRQPSTRLVHSVPLYASSSQSSAGHIHSLPAQHSNSSTMRLFNGGRIHSLPPQRPSVPRRQSPDSLNQPVPLQPPFREISPVHPTGSFGNDNLGPSLHMTDLEKEQKMLDLALEQSLQESLDSSNLEKQMLDLALKQSFQESISIVDSTSREQKMLDMALAQSVQESVSAADVGLSGCGGPSKQGRNDSLPNLGPNEDSITSRNGAGINRPNNGMSKTSLLNNLVDGDSSRGDDDLILDGSTFITESMTTRTDRLQQAPSNSEQRQSTQHDGFSASSYNDHAVAPSVIQLARPLYSRRMSDGR